MHCKNSIQKILRKSLPIHQKRAESLLTASSSLMDGADLTVTSIGREISGTALEKSRIYRSNAIIGNGMLNRDKLLISKSLVDKYFSNRNKLYILVDWSGCCSDKRHILQASIASNGLGRSQPIHSRVHGKEKDEWVKAQKDFLKELAFILSDIKSKIIIITDAGYHSTWFKQVQHFGWDFVGRARGLVKIFLNKTKRWHTVKELYKEATYKSKYLSDGVLSKDKRNGIEAGFYLRKKRLKGTKKPINKQRYPDQEKQYSKMNRDPWLLVTSLKDCEIKEVFQIYTLRMQIEQNFRDIKNERVGFGLENSKTTDRVRLENLLLIALVAAFIALLVGLAAESEGLQKFFQANTVTSRRVLSLIYLGKRIWRTMLDKIPISSIKTSLKYFAQWNGENHD